MSVFAKDPSSTVDYSLDWTELLADGEFIISASWDVSPNEAGGVAITSESGNGRIRGVEVSGGLLGHHYQLTCSALTDQGRTLVRSLSVRVVNR